ncbi:zinc ribbon domain-containing protein [Natronococcus sp. A-GB7]|uniref:FmdB family zinc ribbon protein n=1 Tax=Natronococcus sp. A-GB7 TaxID=3037649 RepID=UPI00241E7C47|nr:zinc ribbon domain-containing protein [Natronococcus sp. A-GB7]MDG5820122.1 zinc ribbon domain-containing protein [Natronococcus sp. A-GB7]
MGLFEKLGRKVGEFTHEAKEAAADEAGYRCEECGNTFYTEQACPECGSENVTERGANAGDDHSPDERDAAEPTDGEESEPSTDSADVSPPTDGADDTTDRE